MTQNNANLALAREDNNKSTKKPALSSRESRKKTNSRGYNYKPNRKTISHVLKENQYERPELSCAEQIPTNTVQSPFTLEKGAIQALFEDRIKHEAASSSALQGLSQDVIHSLCSICASAALEVPSIKALAELQADFHRKEPEKPKNFVLYDRQKHGKPSEFIETQYENILGNSLTVGVLRQWDAGLAQAYTNQVHYSLKKADQKGEELPKILETLPLPSQALEQRRNNIRTMIGENDYYPVALFFDSLRERSKKIGTSRY
jgi:hypothetical protein